MIGRRRALLAIAGTTGAGLLGLAAWQNARGPRDYSLVVVLREGAGDGGPPRLGPGAPRWARLRGAGLSLPLDASGLPSDEFLAALLGGYGPTRGVLPRLGAAGWTTLLAADGPLGPLAPPVDVVLVGQQGPSGVVDALLDALAGRHGDDPSGRAVIVAVLHPVDDEQFGQEVGRLLDGVAPWLAPARTVVVIAQRDARSALVLAPTPPPPLSLRGPATPAELGAVICSIFGFAPGREP